MHLVHAEGVEDLLPGGEAGRGRHVGAWQGLTDVHTVKKQGGLSPL